MEVSEAVCAKKGWGEEEGLRSARAPRKECASSNHQAAKNPRQPEHTFLSTPSQPCFPELAFSSTC